MKKALIVASVVSFIECFNKESVELLQKKLGYEVHIACNFEYRNNVDGTKESPYICQLRHQGIILHNIKFSRNPLSLGNVKAYRQLKHIIDTECFGIIHCHTPVAGVITRLAARRTRSKHGTKILYTAHGFHFYKGAPLANWLFYYPIEKFMCQYTDTLVTINEEDTQLAQQRFSVCNFRMHGVGVDAHRFCPVGDNEKQRIRHQLGLKSDEQIILCVGELNPNKNQQTLIKAASLIIPETPKLRVLIAGKGVSEQYLRTFINRLKLDEHVSLLGFCSNIQQYMQASDIVVSCSFREGLPVNIIEAMLSGKPVVASNNRGHRELVQDGVTGFLLPASAPERVAEKIRTLLSNEELCQNMSHAAMNRGKLYTTSNVLPELERLYAAPQVS